jgi:hypothetical protein
MCCVTTKQKNERPVRAVEKNPKKDKRGILDA